MQSRKDERKQRKGFMGFLETVDLSSDADRSDIDVPPSSHISKKRSDDDFHTVKELNEETDRAEQSSGPAVKPVANMFLSGPAIKPVTAAIADMFLYRVARLFDWLRTSRMFPTVMSQRALCRLLPYADWVIEKYHDAPDSDLVTPDLTNAISQMTFGNNRGKFSGIAELFGYYLLKALGPDGYNAETRMLTCADGTSKKFTLKNVTLTSFFLTLFALPSRPMTLDKEGKPQYSIWQVLYSLAGTSWNPLKETITGELKILDNDSDGKPLMLIDESGKRGVLSSKQVPEVSFYQRRWTEKKVFLMALAVIRVPLFVVFNLVTWPFRFLRNLLKMVTEVLLPVISYGMIKLAEAFWALTEFVANSAYQKGLSIHLLWQIPVLSLVFVLTLTTSIAQYAMSWACRIGLAFSSPLKSALLAYKSGVLILGDANIFTPFSRFVGVLAFVFSMALSATVWAITLPLALGGLGYSSARALGPNCGLITITLYC